MAKKKAASKKVARKVGKKPTTKKAAKKAVKKTTAKKKAVVVRMPGKPKTLALSDFVELQPAGLKSWPVKAAQELSSLILELGIRFPISVYRTKGKKAQTLIEDGVHRIRALRMLEQAGHKIPPIPIMEIKAASLEEAKHIVLLGSTRYATVSAKSLAEFTDLMNGVAKFSFPTVKLDELKIMEGDNARDFVVQLKFSRSSKKQMEKALRLLRESTGLSDEEVILEALRAQAG